MENYAQDCIKLNARPPGKHLACRSEPRSLSSRRCSTSIFMPPVSKTNIQHNKLSGQYK